MAMGIVVAAFDWDEGNWPKCGNHGVKKDEIEYVIKNAKFTIDDPSIDEKRLRTAGQAQSGRFVFVAFTFRHRSSADQMEQTLIRPISARYMHKKEIDQYEKAMAGFKDR